MTALPVDLDLSQLTDPKSVARLTAIFEGDDESAPDHASLITPRWQKLYLHKKQRAFYSSTKRFNITPAGRRSGKTEIAKRRLVKKAIRENRIDGARYIAAAPTNAQAVKIYWRDLCKLVPPYMILGGLNGISISTRTIPLINGAEIVVMGMDVPERSEGSPLAHILLDEFGNMLPKVWDDHISPALIDTLGSADLIGVPEGRNHYHDRYMEALADETGEWGNHHWTSEEILPLFLGYKVDRKALPEDLRMLHPRELGRILAEKEIASAKKRMDPLSYEQEMRASFVMFQGRAYYGYDPDIHAKHPLKYQLNKPLIFIFDFNVSPGVAAVAQEFDANYIPGEAAFTGIIDEVFVPNNSNTPMVCNRLVAKWQHHKGMVRCYGDATGGARKTTAVDGSDWVLIAKVLKPAFLGRLQLRNKPSNPMERVRVNAMNSRIKSIDNTIRFRVDPKNAPNTNKDFEGVQLKEDGSGEIDDSVNKMIGHLSDGIGYYINAEYPLNNFASSMEVY